MDRARGIDVIAVILVTVLVAELVGVVIGQRMIWASGELRTLFRSPLVPSVLVLVSVVLALEGVIKRRTESAMLSRVVALLIIAVALPLAAILGRLFGVWSPSHPVG
ncbi:MAG: hypothetical protein QM817_09210 [Archangium sp.]